MALQLASVKAKVGNRVMERLWRAVREDEERSDTCNRRMIVEEGRHGFQRSLGQNDIGVEQEHELARRPPIRLVDRSGESQILVVLDEGDVGSSGKCIRRAVDGPVIDDDDLTGDILRRLGSGIETPKHEIPCVPVHDQDRHALLPQSLLQNRLRPEISV